MKKLGKLNINPEKVMKNEELITLRGGYSDNCCMCYDGMPIEPAGYMHGVTPSTCDSTCRESGFIYGMWLCII